MEYSDDSDYDDYYDSNNYADSKMEEAEKISYKAWNLRNENKYEEALVLTNQAIKLDPHHFNHLNRKGIILEDLRRYKESLNFYNKALSLKRTKTILNNKAYCILSLIKKRYTYEISNNDALNLINEALSILSSDKDNSEFLIEKGHILRDIGSPIKAHICYLLSKKKFNEINKIEKELNDVKLGYETLINITGIQHYHGLAPFKEGECVKLIKEPDNECDKNAIRVEIDNQTVGYVANSPYTLIKEAKSASDIKHMNIKGAKVLFIIDNYVIAKVF